MKKHLIQKLKQIIAVVTASVMILLLIPTATIIASASTFTKDEVGYYYDTWDDDGTCYVNDYTGNATVLAVPSSINGRTVVGVASYAFSNCTSLVSVTLPETITHIGSHAFSGCLSLSRINIPESVVEIDYWAFEGCNSLKSVYITDMSKWCSIDFESSESNPLSNKARLYLNNELVSELKIPQDVSAIASSAFYNCVSITSATVPSSVFAIGDYAFSNCAALTSVSFDDGLLSVGEAAFENCSALTNVSFDDGLLSLGEAAFKNCSLLPHIALPDSVTSIGDEAFFNCKNLASIVIPKNIASIGSDYTFYNKHIFFGGTETEFLVAIGTNTGWNDNNIHYGVTDGKLETKNVAATCKEGAYTETYCSICNQVFTKTYTSKESSKHAYKTITDKATVDENGSIVKKCKVCKKIASNKTINKIKTVKLSTTKYTYNGKTKKPSVTVKDYKGKKIDDKYYTITRPSSSKKVGEYIVRVKFKTKYSGTVKLTYTINPVKSSVSKLTAAKKSLKVKIRKVSSQASGYEIQYSTSKKFTKSATKTKKFTSYKTTSVTLKSLKANKTYYVRVRTYKTVDGKNYYSAWSSYKSKKTK